MKISQINVMERQLGKLSQLMKPGYRQEIKPEQEATVEQINLRITEIENLLLDLKSTTNSSAAKIMRWFQELSDTNDYFKEVFTFQVNESCFTLNISLAKALNINLSHVPNNYYQYQVPADVEFKDRWARNNNQFVNQTWTRGADFESLITIPEIGHHQVTGHFIYLEFKYSKRLVNDPEVLSQIMTDLIQRIKTYLDQSKKQG